MMSVSLRNWEAVWPSSDTTMPMLLHITHSVRFIFSCDIQAFRPCPPRSERSSPISAPVPQTRLASRVTSSSGSWRNEDLLRGTQRLNLTPRLARKIPLPPGFQSSRKQRAQKRSALLRGVPGKCRNRRSREPLNGEISSAGAERGFVGENWG